MHRISISAGVAIFICAPLYANEPYFRYAGITLETSMDEIKDRYPNSKFSRTTIYVDPRDSHDHIYQITISDNENNPHVRLFFQRKDMAPDGVNYSLVFPRCRPVFNEIYRNYGGPHIIQRHYAAATKMFYRIWRVGDERLQLFCHYRGDVPYASQLGITSIEP